MLSPLREDLNLHPSSTSSYGSPNWTIHDPVRNKFFQIEWRVYEVLRHWKKGTAKLIVDAVNAETSLEIDESFIIGVENFFRSNQLCLVNDNQSIKNLINQNKNIKSSWFSWLLHHYLFFRIPIFKCDKFLTVVLPYVKFLFSKWFIVLTAVCLVLGLFLIAHQWDVFVSQLLDLFSFKGLIFFFITLVFVKVAHEFGHGFAAKKYGCKVPVMGVAFLVLWPMFYTDTNESWKLRSQSQRLNIVRAGVTVELMIASFATLAWSFLPSGVLRDMSFIMATITWVSSLVINASPFMRFDGYYLLSDYWNIPNLHERSGKLARWWLREKLFNLNEERPEFFSRRKEILLIGFAFTVWVYRLILFIGIALLVYNFFVKILGIFLFVTEIVWFVMRPIWLEIREWRLRKNLIFAKTRIWLIFLILLLTTISLFIPWRGSIVLDAVIQVNPYKVIYTKTGGRLEKVILTEGVSVQEGQLIVRFRNPNLEFKLLHLINKIKVQKEILQLSAFDKLSWKRNAIIAAELAYLETEKKALDKKISSLNIYAPISGVSSDISRDLLVGQWLSGGQRLFAILGTGGGFKVTAYLNEEDVSRVEKGGSCFFMLQQRGFERYRCALRKIGSSSENRIEEKMLATLYGGNISANYMQESLIPSQAVYKLTADIKNVELKLQHKTKGKIEVDAVGRNIIDRFWHWFVAIIIREGGM